MDFKEDFKRFLTESEIEFKTTSDGLSFDCYKNKVKYQLVPLEGDYPIEAESDITYIYEDRWFFEGDILKKRILAHLGHFRSIFARKCTVVSIDTATASSFLNKYHSYGSAKSKYRYGLYLGEELVAVASFSEPRLMPRWLNGERFAVESYEWVRYASLPDSRVIGGMGRLLSQFVKDIHPQEVMTYSDKEWSAGLVYRTLGFKWFSDREPVEFYVNKKSFERISVKKAEQDNEYRDFKLTEEFIKIKNLGSAKYLKLYI